MFALLARFALAGVLAGALAGIVDFALAHAGIAAFLPTGSLRLLGFLVGLYGFFGALTGVAMALVARVLEATDVGSLLRPSQGERLGGRLVAYVVALAAGLVGLSAATRHIVENAFTLFHNHLLIGALAGAAVVGLVLAVLFLALLVAPLASYALRVGPRAHLVLRNPIGALPSLVLGLYVTAAIVAVQVVHLAGRPRMTNPQRALNAAIGAPFFALTGLVVGYVAYRFVRPRVRVTYLGVLGVTLATTLTPVAIAAAASWSTVRQLDLRPFLTGGLIVVVTLALYPFLRSRAAYVLVPLTIVAALGLGRIPRVRKAGELVGLAPQLVRAVQAGSDLDRDGYSSLLGGGDCDDLDARVHPGAFDWPDDGIDQDCNGHEATLQKTAQRVYADVPPSVPEQPNVLLLTIDALRADHVSAYGYERRTTPRLDELARDGVRFENAWSHAPSTRYSVPAILTGRYPSTIAVNPDPRVHWPPQVLPENRLVAEMMKGLGYRTGAMLSYYYFERGWGLDQGFDDYDYHLQTLHSIGGDPSATRGTSSHELADLDIAWLKEHQGEHFFLWSHFYDTHFQFQAHPDVPESNFGSDEKALYDGEIRFTDFHIGRVIDALKELGLYDKTIIVVTSDHGDGFGEHGIPVSKRHGYHLYRTETKVPIIIHAPGIAARVVDTPIGHVDLLPTVLNLLRRPSSEEPQLAGESQLGAMLGDDHEKDTRSIYQEVWYEGPTSKKALVTRAWHLLRNLVPDDTTELYDLVHDAAEEHDVSGLGDPIEQALSTKLGEITDALAIPPDFARLYKDALGRAPTAPTIVLDDELGDFARVVGVDVADAKVAPGRTTTVTVHLQIRRSIPDGWILFTHVEGPMGRSMNLDHAPLGGLVPLHSLEAGQWVRDPITISFPATWPRGQARVVLGLYRKGTRAPARGSHSAGGAVTAATIEVAP